ncbi:universal stress protein [Streptomyces abyssomicinicus]|uniref:universal stress protein n=1 Tax=Streptomyces abyssomicinicus TaxID=574929 RepID=UPI001250C46F|nr:universal stress protein [Streptomyces abyssomicinicus]
MTLPVIAAVDGSEDSLRSLDWAVRTALMRGAPVRVVHVRQYPAWAPPEFVAVGTADDPVLDQVRARIEAGGGARPDVEYLSRVGAPGTVLAELSTEGSLLVVGSRGRGGFASLLLGSTSIAVARDSHCPVVVVPRSARQVPDDLAGASTGPRVVVGLGVDHAGDAALEFAFAEAEMRRVRVQAVCAYPWPPQIWAVPGEFTLPMIDEADVAAETRELAGERLAPLRERHPRVAVEIAVEGGDAAGRLVAHSKDAELVVVGRHQRRLLVPTRMVGSVTQAVLLHAAAPVAVVAPHPHGDAGDTDGTGPAGE